MFLDCFLLQQGAVGLSIWVPSVTTQPKETEVSDTKSSPRGYCAVSPAEDKNEDIWRQTGERDDIELSVIGNFSNYKPIDVDILLENMKVLLLPFLLGPICEKKPSFCRFGFYYCFISEPFFTEQTLFVVFLFYQVSQAMSNNFLKISLTQTLREALSCMRDGQQNCVLVVDAEDSLEGILTDGDIKRWLSNRSGDASNSDLVDVCLIVFSMILLT